MCKTHRLIRFFLSVIFFIKFALSVVYEQHNFRHNFTSDLIVTSTLGVGT